MRQQHCAFGAQAAEAAFPPHEYMNMNIKQKFGASLRASFDPGASLSGTSVTRRRRRRRLRKGRKGGWCNNSRIIASVYSEFIRRVVVTGARNRSLEK